MNEYDTTLEPIVLDGVHLTFLMSKDRSDFVLLC
jgi:hypothetical protein